MHKVELLRDAGYVVHILWEHEWDLERRKPEVHDRIKHLAERFKEPLNPRDSFFGGRTDGCSLFRQVEGEEKNLVLRFYKSLSLHK